MVVNFIFLYEKSLIPCKVVSVELFFFVAEFSRKNNFFCFCSGILMSRKRPIYFNSWHTSKPKLHVFNSLCYKTSSRCFSKAFLSIENHLIEENWFFKDNKVFRFLQFIQKPDRTKLGKRANCTNAFQYFNAFFSEKWLWTHPSKSDSMM